MSDINIDELLQELSPDAPCGEDLEYDAAFGEMERAAEGKPEQQFGDTIVPAEAPDWRDLKRKALDVLARSKDLRAAVYLARAAINVDGFAAFADCMSLLRGYVERYWDPVHPLLDPDDNYDPTLRVNTLATLCDLQATLQYLRRAPLVSSRAIGRYGLHDLDVARGEVPPPEGEEAPKTSTIEAAFMDADVQELQTTAAAVKQAADSVQALDKSLTDYVGVGNSTSFEPLVHVLRDADKCLTEQMARRGLGEQATDEAAGDDGDQGGEAAAGTAAGEQRLSGVITSREDVIRALDKICEYYDRFEPSSPLPMLLKRAKRLTNKTFMEIIRDLTPDAIGQAEAIGGVSGEEEVEQEQEKASEW